MPKPGNIGQDLNPALSNATQRLGDPLATLIGLPLARDQYAMKATASALDSWSKGLVNDPSVERAEKDMESFDVMVDRFPKNRNVQSILSNARPLIEQRLQYAEKRESIIAENTTVLAGIDKMQEEGRYSEALDAVKKQAIKSLGEAKYSSKTANAELGARLQDEMVQSIAHGMLHGIDKDKETEGIQYGKLDAGVTEFLKTAEYYITDMKDYDTGIAMLQDYNKSLLTSTTGLTPNQRYTHALDVVGNGLGGAFNELEQLRLGVNSLSKRTLDHMGLGLDDAAKDASLVMAQVPSMGGKWEEATPNVLSNTRKFAAGNMRSLAIWLEQGGILEDLWKAVGGGEELKINSKMNDDELMHVIGLGLQDTDGGIGGDYFKHGFKFWKTVENGDDIVKTIEAHYQLWNQAGQNLSTFNNARQLKIDRNTAGMLELAQDLQLPYGTPPPDGKKDTKPKDTASNIKPGGRPGGNAGGGGDRPSEAGAYGNIQAMLTDADAYKNDELDVFLNTGSHQFDQTISGKVGPLGSLRQVLDKKDKLVGRTSDPLQDAWNDLTNFISNLDVGAPDVSPEEIRKRGKSRY